MYCRNCGKEINEKAVLCVHCGKSTGVPIGNENNNVKNANDEASVGLLVLAVLFPIIGLIIGAVCISIGAVNAGKKYIRYAAVSFVICFLIIFIWYLL